MVWLNRIPMDVNEHVRFLFAKYIRKECSAKEFEEMLTWLVAMDEEEKNNLSAPMHELWDQAMAGKLPSVADQVDWDLVLGRVLESSGQDETIPIEIVQTRRIGWRKIAAAVVILGLIISGSILFLNRKTPTPLVKTEKKIPHLPEEIVAKGNQAILTLANGTVIIT